MRRKVMIIIVTLSLAPTLLIGYVMNFYAQSALLDAKRETLSTIAQMTDYHITRYYNTLLSNIQKKAEDESMKGLLAGPAENRVTFSNGEGPDIRILLLEDVCYPVISGAVIDATGKTILSSLPSEEGMMMDKTEFYRNIMEGKEAYLHLTTVSMDSEQALFAVPIRNEDGKTIGILKQILNLKPLKNYFDKLNVDEDSFVFLLRKNGSIVFQNKNENKSMLFNEYQNANSLDQLIGAFQRNRMESEKGFVEFKRKGAVYTGVYRKLEKIDCVVVASVNRESIFTSLDQCRQILLITVVFLVFAAVSSGFYINSLFANPLKGICNTVKKIASGNLTVRCSNQGYSELNELTGSINKLTENLEKCERELRLSARIDSLTHLPNRYAIFEALDTLLYKHPNQALLFLDIDRFEEINDKLGYDIGDDILIEVGDVLRRLPQHVCYPSRLGGDKFLIFISNWTAEKYPERIAKKIIKEIEGIHFIDEIRVDISVSIGLAYANADRTDKKQLIKNSSIAMHKAKNSGKNTYNVYC